MILEKISYRFDATELDRWAHDGFVFRRAVFDHEEVERLLTDGPLAAERCQEAAVEDAAQYFVYHNSGRDTLSIFAGLDHTGTAFEAMCCDRRLVEPAYQLYGDQQYIHHAKFMNKKAFEGIAWLWHQDYGYWQRMGSIRPHMFSAMVFLDQATPENGCLNVFPGSHKLGRLPHREDGDTGGALKMTFLGNETMADVAADHQVHPVVAEPGDVLFFHCNLIHSSGHNLSAHDRRAAIVAFNADANRPPGHQHWPLVSCGRDDAIRHFVTESSWHIQ